MTDLPARCTCPTHHTDSGVQRFAADQACPIHGQKQQQRTHCSTCTCGEVPIVQTPTVAAAMRASEGETK